MRWLTGILLFLFALAPASAEILYKATLNQQTVYILGTIHAASHPDTRLSEQTEKLIKTADSIYLELDPSDLMQGGMLMMQEGTREGDRLQDYLDDQTWQRLLEIATEHQIPVSALNNMQAWLAELIILTQVMQQQGFSGQKGIESQIITLAQSMDRPIRGLETVADQIRFLKAAQANASEQEIIEVLLLELSNLGEELDDLEMLWQQGKLDELTELVTENLSDDMRDVILTARNTQWADYILNNLEELNVFIAVGAGHLGGDDGLLRLLESSGATVSPIND